MIAMAGMYLGRSADVPVIRHRDDHRRRGRGSGLADRAARDSSPGSATGSRRGASRSSRTSRGTPARAALWARILNPVLRHPVDLGRRPPAACCVVLAIPALQPPHGDPGRRDRCRRTSAVIKTYNKIQAAFPGGPIPAVVVAVSADDVTSPEVSARDRRSARAGRREPELQAADHDRTSTPTARSPRSTSPWPGTAATRSRTRRWPSCATS